jgi:hypothetical protein
MPGRGVWDIRMSGLGFVSDFENRISDLEVTWTHRPPRLR